MRDTNRLTLPVRVILAAAIGLAAISVPLCSIAQQPTRINHGRGPGRGRPEASGLPYPPGSGGHFRQPGGIYIDAGPFVPYDAGIDATALTRSRASYRVVDRSPANLEIISAGGVRAASLFRSLAESAIHHGRYDDAVRFVSHALIEDAGDGELHVLLAQTLIAKKEYDHAAVSLRQGLALMIRQDQRPTATIQRRVFQDQFYEHQIAELSKSISEKPESKSARFLRSYQYMVLGRDDAARSDLRAVFQLDPSDTLVEELLQRIPGDTDTQLPWEELPVPAPQD